MATPTELNDLLAESRPWQRLGTPDIELTTSQHL